MDSALGAGAVEVPVWERAHKALDTITEDMRMRLSDIEHAQARLAGEADAIRSVLQRITSQPPQQVIGHGIGNTLAPTRY